MTYNEFLQNIINTRGQWSIPEGDYYEVHHILPKCLGGLPDSHTHSSKHENLIWLYPKEHFIAHKLLALENPTCYPIITAFRLMCSTTRRSSTFIEKADIDITPEDYALCRELFSSCPMPDEVRKKISDKHTGKSQPKQNKENYGKWRTGRHVYINPETNSKLFIADDEIIPAGYIAQTEITKAKEAEKKLLKADGRHKVKTNEQKLALSKAMKDKELHWYTNGVDELRCKIENCPAGWYPGRSELKKQQIKENNKHVRNSGEKNGMYNKHHTEEAKQKISNFGKGKHWFNNDELEVFVFTCPEGFKPGRIKKIRKETK